MGKAFDDNTDQSQEKYLEHKSPVSRAIEELDNWKHRAVNMRCRSCMWFVRKKVSSPRRIGRCRRHCPTMNGWPVVFGDDWCGDHKLDEEKV